MRQWSAIPTEIFNIILFYVIENCNLQERQNQLSQCTLTCRSWREIAQSFLFSKIELRDSEKASEELLRHLMLSNNRLGYYVKDLTISSNVCTPTSLTIIDSLFPNLGKIKFPRDDVNYPFFCKLITAEGKFSKLTSVPVPIMFEHFDMYVECLFALKSQTTEVHLLEDDEQETPGYSNLCNKLYQFPKLQSVYVCVEKNDRISTRNVMDYMEYITTQGLVHLRKLKFTLAESNNLHFSRKELRFVQSSATIKDISINVYDREDAIPNEQCMLYIMKKFPNPNRIQFTQTTPFRFGLDGGVIRSQEYTNISATVTLQFLQYLCKIRDCCVLNILVDTSLASLIKDLLSSINSQTGTKIPRIHISCGRYHVTGDSPISALIDVKSDSVGENAHTISIVLNVRGLKQQRANLFKEAGCYFTEATLHVNTFDGDLVSILSCILKYCNQLENLEIKSRGCSVYIPSLVMGKVKNYSVKRLDVDGVAMPAPNRFCYISRHFACLEDLTFNKFFETAATNFISAEKMFSIFLDNSSLKHLNIKTEGILGLTHLCGIHVNITTDAGQSRRISFSANTREDIISTARRYYFVPLERFKNTNDPGWFTCKIHCRSIKKVEITFPTTRITSSGEDEELTQTYSLSF